MDIRNVMGKTPSPALILATMLRFWRGEEIVSAATKVEEVKKHEQADWAQASIATAQFGTSMSAHPNLAVKQLPRVGLFAH